MWPLSVFLFLATAAPQQNPAHVSQDFRHLTLPVMQHRQPDETIARKLLEESQRNICYTMRSYFFRRQDDRAPVPAGMSTCIPANVTRQLQVSPEPRVRFVPLAAQSDGR
jgi:hypothetical protein